MSTVVVFNGTNYTVPSYGDTGYAQGPGNLSAYLVALASSVVNVGNQTIAGNKTFTGLVEIADGSLGNPSLAFASGIGYGLSNSGGVFTVNSLNGGIVFYASNSPSSGATSNRWKLSLRETTEGDMSLFHWNGSSYDLRFYMTNLGVATFSGQLIGMGTATNDSAATGYIGQWVQASVATGSAVSATGTGQYFTITSISLTAGDWDISALVEMFPNGAVVTNNRGAIGTTTGNDGTGLIQGDNFIDVPICTATADSTASIPNYRVSIAGTTVYYLKSFMGYSAGTPKAYGRISARRVR